MYRSNTEKYQYLSEFDSYVKEKIEKHQYLVKDYDDGEPN